MRRSRKTQREREREGENSKSRFPYSAFREKAAAVTDIALLFCIYDVEYYYSICNGFIIIRYRFVCDRNRLVKATPTVYVVAKWRSFSVKLLLGIPNWTRSELSTGLLWRYYFHDTRWIRSHITVWKYIIHVLHVILSFTLYEIFNN